MADRPANHVTSAAMASRLVRASAFAGWPEVPDDLVAFLEDLYPPECFAGGGEEALRKHLRYGGAQALVAVLRDRCEAQKKEALEVDPEDGGVLIEPEA